MSDGEQNLTQEIQVYEVGRRRLYAKTSGRGFVIFEDELTPEELIAIAKDIEARQNLKEDTNTLTTC
jgi:hypothetical protein